MLETRLSLPIIDYLMTEHEIDEPTFSGAGLWFGLYKHILDNTIDYMLDNTMNAC